MKWGEKIITEPELELEPEPVSEHLAVKTNLYSVNLESFGSSLEQLSREECGEACPQMNLSCRRYLCQKLVIPVLMRPFDGSYDVCVCVCVE